MVVRRTLLLFLTVVVVAVIIVACSPTQNRRYLARSNEVTVAELERLAQVNDDSLQYWVALNPRTPEPTLFYLAGIPYANNAIFSNPSSTEAVLLKALKNLREIDKTNGRAAALVHPAVTTTIIEFLAAGVGYDSYLKEKIAVHPLATPKALDDILKAKAFEDFYPDYVPLVASHPNTRPETIARLASKLEPEDTKLLMALLLNPNLDFESQWIITQKSNSPWTRRRLFSRPDASEFMDTLDAEDLILVLRSQLEWHGTSPRAMSSAMAAELQAYKDDAIAVDSYKSAVAIRRAALALQRTYPHMVLDFYQSIGADDIYSGECPSVRIVIENIRFEVKRTANDPFKTFIWSGKGPPGGIILCDPNAISQSGPSIWYREVDLATVTKKLQRVLDGYDLGDPFKVLTEVAFVAESETFFTWSELRKRFNWSGKRHDPKLILLDGPAGVEITRATKTVPSTIAIGWMLFDNLDIDGHIIVSADGINVSVGTTIYRKWSP